MCSSCYHIAKHASPIFPFVLLSQFLLSYTARIECINNANLDLFDLPTSYTPIIILLLHKNRIHYKKITRWMKKRDQKMYKIIISTKGG